MKQVYIIDALRTPIGSFGGNLQTLSATKLGAIVIKKLVEKSGIDIQLIDEVIMGNVLQAGVGQAPARQTSKFANLSDSTICTTVNKVCASGMKAINMATQSILLGDADVIIAGGMESMSNTPFYNNSIRWGNKLGNVILEDGIMKDGLTDVYNQTAMGVAAELCATNYNINREEQDHFAVMSYKKSIAAWENDLFLNEVVPIEINERNNIKIINKDEEPYKVNFDKIVALKSVFKKEGTVTAANASKINDGAAAALLMSDEKANELNLKPLAVIRGYADAEQSPDLFTTTPTLAIQKLLKKVDLSIDDIDYFELNEAFSVVGIANGNLLNINPLKLNVHGGAVALGHPLGCSGARIVVTLAHILKNRKAKYGVAAICNGGGGASAILIENIF